MKKIVVDHERCQGHGRCYDLAPEVLGADDDGHVTVLVPDGQVPAHAEPQAVLAVKNCPEQALSLLSCRRWSPAPGSWTGRKSSPPSAASTTS